MDLNRVMMKHTVIVIIKKTRNICLGPRSCLVNV